MTLYFSFWGAPRPSPGLHSSTPLGDFHPPDPLTQAPQTKFSRAAYVNTWNSLPSYVVSANATNVFKNRLDKFWHDQEIIYDFNAQLEGTRSRSAVE